MKLKSMLVGLVVCVCASISTMAASKECYCVKLSEYNLMGRFNVKLVDNNKEDILFSRINCYISPSNMKLFKKLSNKAIELNVNDFEKIKTLFPKLEKYGMYLEYANEKECTEPVSENEKKALARFDRYMTDLLNLLDSNFSQRV